MLRNMTVFLTGAAGSLGSATAKKLVKEGCKVTLFDLPESKGKELADKLGEKAMFFPGDVTSESDVENALQEATSKFGHLRTVINCAAVHRTAAMYSNKRKACITSDFLESILKVNVMGTFNVIRLSLSHLIKAPVLEESDLRGLVLNTSGFAAFDGQPGQVPLAASWGAIDSMTLPLCRELGDFGIRVMTISPGLMETSLTSFMPGKVISALSVLTPSPKRLGKKEEYADLVLAVIQNNYLNGEVLRLNGGLRLNL